MNKEQPSILSRVIAWGYMAVLAVAFLGSCWLYGKPLVKYGFYKGMDRLLWACVDALNMFAADFHTTYAAANILLFVILAPLLTLVSCIGLKIESRKVRNIIFYTVLTVGLVLLWILTKDYYIGYLRRYGSF
jgi:hypothetical protein